MLAVKNVCRTIFLQVCTFFGLTKQNDRDVEGSILLQTLKKNSQITPSKNKCTLFFFQQTAFNTFCEFSGGSVSLFLSAELFLGLWQTLHVSLDAKKFFLVPLEAWLCVTSLFALTCLPCSQDTACSRHRFGSLQPGDPKSPISFLLEEA